MLTFIFRVFIVFTVFIAGAFVGNIYMPQKTLEQSYIVALDMPETSFDIQNAPGLQNALHALEQIKTNLQNTQIGKETLFNLEDIIKKQLYAEAFQAAKADYAIQMLKVQKHPEIHDAFLKAKSKYYSVSGMINTTFPPKPKEEILVLDTPAAEQVGKIISTPIASPQVQPVTKQVSTMSANGDIKQEKTK